MKTKVFDNKTLNESFIYNVNKNHVMPSINSIVSLMTLNSLFILNANH